MYNIVSRPVWGAWIEIAVMPSGNFSRLSRAPYGARGLKLLLQPGRPCCLWSRPVWGAWIEMLWWMLIPSEIWVAPRMGRVD